MGAINETLGKSLLILDLDGTLFDSSHREHLARAKQWEAFHAAGGHDPVAWNVVEAVRLLLSQGTLYPILITGRNEWYREATEAQMAKLPFNVDAVLMRPDGDMTSDADLKPRLLCEYLFGEGYTPEQEAHAARITLLALDDRDRVVSAWRRFGITCLQVKEGAF